MARQPDPTPAPAQVQASREATDWLIWLQEDPDSVELRRRFDEWLHENPLNAEAWAVVEHTTGIISRAPVAHADKWGEYQRSVKAQAFRPHRRAVQAAVLALAAGLALWFAPAALVQLQSDHATGTAEVRTVTLADGSTVTLAPDSAIAVAYAGTERRVDLLGGEAFFDVARDSDRPFRVVTDGIRITVLGTRFDMRRTGGGADVAVEHGTVRVDYDTVSPPVSEKLEAGQGVRVSWAGEAQRRAVASTQVAAWRAGRLVAQDEPLGNVIDRLRTYYAGAIVLADPGLAGRSVTGVYNLADPVEAVRGVAHAHGATVRRLTPWLIIVTGF